VIGGLVTSTLLTLGGVPVVFSLIEGLRDRSRRTGAAPSRFSSSPSLFASRSRAMNLAKVFSIPPQAGAAAATRSLLPPTRRSCNRCIAAGSTLLAPTVDVCPVELPGRGVRLAEPPVSDMTRCATGSRRRIECLPDDVPMAMIGHSMGARIAFEVSRRFEGRVIHLFASGIARAGSPAALRLAARCQPTAQLTDIELKQRLREMEARRPRSSPTTT
jgi:hypothetical protein